MHKTRLLLHKQIKYTVNVEKNKDNNKKKIKERKIKTNNNGMTTLHM